MRHDDHEALAKEIREALSPLRNARVPEPSPFLKTRVLARLREQERALPFWKRLPVWRVAGAFSASLAVAWVVWTYHSPMAHVYPATMGQPVAVQVDMKALSKAQVAYAKVELPKGVKFYSRNFPAIAEKESLDLSWKDQKVPNALPIIVKAEEKGIRTVRVKFFDGGNKLVGERFLKIRFDAGPGSHSSIGEAV